MAERIGRRVTVVTAVAAVLTALLSPWATGTSSAAIADGARGGVPEFFWLPPMVTTAPATTSPFDPSALTELVVEVCKLDAAGSCVAGPPTARYTSTTRGERIELKTRKERYEVEWEPSRRSVDPAAFYRVRVLRSGAELGSIDVDVVRNRAERAAVDRNAYVPLELGDELDITFRLQEPSAPTRVKINEVESQNGDPDDWVELFNTASRPVDLSGYIIRDNDDTHTYVIPAGTTIAARGHAVIEANQLGFGLGGSDSVRLYTRDGLTVFDSYTWTAHAPTTYGRCPDGTGQFQVLNSTTKGAANDCTFVVGINEVESSGGVPGDWVELHNPGPAPADVSGFRFLDNDDTRIPYVIPAGTVLAAGAYLALDEAQFGFGLGSADSARLFRPDGTLADSYSWTAHAATTYGRCPNWVGPFGPTTTPTKAAANNCAPPPTVVKFNEVESNGGVPGDWFELVNTGNAPVDLTGFRFLDNDDTRTPYVFPAGSVLAPGTFLVVDEASFGFGLGSADSVRLFDPSNNPVDSYSWTAHALTSYSRCPDGSGPFATSLAVTKGTANACGSPVKVNEVESDGGVPGDWVELYNPTDAPADISGFVLRDNDDTHAFTIPAATIIPARGFLVVDEASLGFSLDNADSARLFDSAGAPVDSYTWTTHAPTSYGRCPDGTGAFDTTTAATRAAVNRCPGIPVFDPWPGSADVVTVDTLNTFPSNLSGLDYQASGGTTPGVLWAVRNGPGTLHRLVSNGTVWAPDTSNGWAAGKALRYGDGTGDVDAEGVTLVASDPGAVYVGSERNNGANGISRNAIVRFDTTTADTSLSATAEWDLTADLPVTGPNAGIEAVIWVPDSFLVAQGFRDQATGNAYDPATYPGHGDGLFFVGLEATGGIYAYALTGGGTFTRVATIASGFPGVMALEFDTDQGNLWALCDDGCQGRSSILRVNAAGAFAVTASYERPVAMPNINNEGFAITPPSECGAGTRPVFWADDSSTGGNALRQGSLAC